ncbi:MAG: polysaccharide biosynthesis protein, partial [Planctomycetales bacterium]|nr:polysaccharide biosynthesis protein [Planctomycetales bacterium]
MPRCDLIVALALIALMPAVYYLALWLRFEGDVTGKTLRLYADTVGVVIFAKACAFAWFGVHRGWTRHVTFDGLIVLFKAATIGLLSTVMLKFLLMPALPVPRSVFILDWFLMFGAIAVFRAARRFFTERSPFPVFGDDKSRVFIVGTSEAGEALLRATRRTAELPYRVVGFITQDEAEIGTQIDGAPVLGGLADVGALAKEHRVDEILITAGDLPGSVVRQLVADGKAWDVEVRVLPDMAKILTGRLNVQPRTVSIEDLLRRDPVRLDSRQLHDWLDGRTVLVTGAAGSIGSEICRQLLQFSPQTIVLVDRSENGLFFLERELSEIRGDCRLEVCLADVADPSRMETILQRFRPEIIFHAAAYKHVPMVELNPGEAVKNVPLATQTLADLAECHGVESFVMISTDKAVNPTSVMGTCKRVAELYVQALAAQSTCRFVTVRFGNVLDSAGSVVPIFRQQIARGGPVTVTHRDVVRYFMTIPEASQLVIQAGAMGSGGEIFVLDMGDPVRIMDLAADM